MDIRSPAVKLNVAGEIQYAVSKLWEKDLSADMMSFEYEVTNISDLVTQIKVTGAQGGPRYFSVKVSEVL